MKVIENENIGITLKIAVCDDIPEHLDCVCRCVSDTKVENVSVRTEQFTSVTHLLDEIIADKEKFDVVIVDIKMPDMDGITFGKRLAEISPDTVLVLLTAYPEFAIEGYETRAYRYLLKPVTEVEMEKLFRDIFRERRKTKYLRITTLKAEYAVALNDILYLSAKDKYTIIHTKEMEYYDSTSLNEYEKKLAPYGFFRIHRSYIVNISYHSGMSKNSVILQNNKILPISRRKKSAYNEAMRVELERRLRL